MSVIRENMFFAVLAVTAVPLLILGSVQNSIATNSEIRMLADLNPPTNVGGIADGRADYRERGNSMRLNVEVEDVFPNSTFTVEVSGEPIGTIRTSSFGTGELELNTNDGQAVSKILTGDLVEIFQGTELVLSGGFDDDGDGNIEDDNNNQVPITPTKNSSMQAGSNSSDTITTVITVPQDADDLGAGAYSPNPASVSGDSTITWNNIDDSPHTATADDGSFDTGIINGGSSGSALISASTGTRTIPYHCNVHPEMRGTLQVIALSTIPSSNSTLQDAPVTVTSSSNNSTIQNLQEAILALQQAIGSLQQALVALQQSASQDGNVTIFSGNNNTAASPIQEEQQQQEQQQPALPPPQQPQSQQQQQGQQQDLTVSIVQGSSTLTDNGGFQPNPIQLQAGDTVTWRNDDLEAHTVTSGSNGVPDNKFNSSPNFIPLITPGATFDHTFIQAGEYHYFCLLHPNTVGTVTVVS